MTGRREDKNLVRNIPKNKMRIPQNSHRPFWVYTSSYYIFAVAIAIAAFFLTWGILLDNQGETPWIPAGLVASLMLIFAVILREFVLRRLQRQFISAQDQLNYNLRAVNKPNRNLPNVSTFSLEKNADIIKQIEDKSKAARTLGKLPAGHLEVFELCDEYLRLNKKESERAGLGATRLAAFRRGKEKIETFHKYHLLAWASIESNMLIQDAKIRVTIGEKLEKAQKSLSILDTAIQYYPSEPQIIDSITAVKEFIVSIKVSHWIEQAERAAFKENYKRAINFYRDALFFLAREQERSPERDLTAEKINSEIEKMRKFLKNDKEKLPPAQNKN